MEQKDINHIIDSKNKQEKRARNRSVLTISVLFLIGLSWLFWTNNQVNRMHDKIIDLNDTIQSKELKIEQLQESVTNLNFHLHEADNFKTYKVDISPEDKKYYLYTDEINRSVSEVFKKMMDFQNQEVEFNINGKSAEKGFNSPAFMTYLLSTIGIIDSIELNSSGLISKFDRVSDNYQPGDIIIYKAGYCMMYFANNYINNDYDSFVFGMTPSGIIALRPDFAEEIVRLRPRY